MGFSEENGYVPTSISTMMDNVRQNINAQFGTDYTLEQFVGTNFYKYFYALMQKLQENEVKTSEIFLKLQDYFETTNEVISRPVVTPNGLIDALAAEGFTASVKPPLEADAGKIYVCVDTDELAGNYAAVKLQINTLIKDYVVGGVVSQGTESSTIVLSNGQSFDFKFNLPNRIEPLLRLTIVTSENNQSVILSPDEIKAKLIENIESRYSLGKNFEPQRYFSIIDAPWAASVLLEYSLDAGSSWDDAVINADYDDLYVIELANITLVES